MEHKFRDSWYQNSTKDISKFCVLTGNVFQLFYPFETLLLFALTVAVYSRHIMQQLDE